MLYEHRYDSVKELGSLNRDNLVLALSNGGGMVRCDIYDAVIRASVPPSRREAMTRSLMCLDMALTWWNEQGLSCKFVDVNGIDLITNTRDRKSEHNYRRIYLYFDDPESLTLFHIMIQGYID